MNESLYNQILIDAQELMEGDTGDAFLEPTSALRQVANDRGIPYGAEMEEFVTWGLDQMSGNHMHENKQGGLDWNKDIINKTAGDETTRFVVVDKSGKEVTRGYTNISYFEAKECLKRDFEEEFNKDLTKEISLGNYKIKEQ